MSLVYITHHNENIAAIEKHLNFLRLTRSKFNSKFRKSHEKEFEKPHMIKLNERKVMLTDSPKCNHRSMGPAEEVLRNPCQFLRKNEGLQWCRENLHTCVKVTTRPVPRYDRTKKLPIVKKPPNFILENILKMKSAPGRQWAPRYIDTVRGESHNLIESGLVPQYTCHHNFARVPCYLRYNKKQYKKLHDECEEQIEQKVEICAPLLAKNKLRSLSDEERTTIITGLKQNFDGLYSAYQRQTVYADTLAKKLRKGQLEEQMRLLEQDIFLIENNPVIYVSNF